MVEQLLDLKRGDRGGGSRTSGHGRGLGQARRDKAEFSLINYRYIFVAVEIHWAYKLRRLHLFGGHSRRWLVAESSLLQGHEAILVQILSPIGPNTKATLVFGRVAKETTA